MRDKRTLLLACALPALFLAGCNKAEEDAAAPATDAAEEAAADSASSGRDAAGPSISGAVAPGVAFAYRYAFTLPAQAITKVQQQHAAACQQLGTARCRVTGMAYDQPREGEVEARIDFLLAPDLAHRFGSEGISLVEAAKGKLENAAISGEDAGKAITLSQQDSAAAEAEIKRIEQRLAAPGLTRAERVELQQQIAGLREQQRGQAAHRREREQAIATTPVSFAYASEGLIGGSNTFGKAASASWGSAQTALNVVMLVTGVALPWLLLLGLIVLLFRSPDLRRLLKRLFGAGSAEPAKSE